MNTPKILFVTQGNGPENITSGAGQRSYFLGKALTQIGQVDYLNIASSDDLNKLDYSFNSILKLKYTEKNSTTQSNLKLKDKIKNIFKLIFQKKPLYPINLNLSKAVKKLIVEKNYDFIVIRYLNVAYLTGLNNYNNLIVDVDDCPIEAFRLHNRLYKYPILRNIFLIKIKREYYKFLKEHSLSFIANKKDIKNKNQIFLPNLPFKNKIKELYKEIKNSPKINPKSALFIGSMYWKPNYKSIEYFIENIWNEIITQIPDFEFYIIGKELPGEIEKKIENIKGIHYLGFVEDIEPYFKNCMMYISPIIEGTGTNIKILEAIENGIPIVCTKKSIRGFEDFLKDGKNIFIVKNNKDFVKKISKLYSHPELRIKFSKEAKRDFLNNNYTFEKFSKIVSSHINNLIKNNNEV